MTGKTYLKKVRRRLNLPKTWRDRVISDLSSSIAARMEEGRPEDEVLRELGSPGKIAAEFNEQLKEHCFRKSPWRFVFLALAILGLLWLLWIIFIDALAGHMLSHSIGIIGGADGPTSVFIASVSMAPAEYLLPLLGLAIGAAGYLWLRRCKCKDGGNMQ